MEVLTHDCEKLLEAKQKAKQINKLLTIAVEQE